MPIYDFKCKSCDKVFEELCKFNVYDSVVCSCGSKKIELLMSIPAITFSNPLESSKFHDSFSYRAGVKAEKAKGERRFAEANDHMGVNPYKD